MEDVACVTVGREHVGQGRRVAEGVHIVANLRAHPETVLEVALAVDDLAVEAHDRREVEVGLDVLAPVMCHRSLSTSRRTRSKSSGSIRSTCSKSQDSRG